jgi:NAD(P)-dependent dehydrogenase (short-subunit alcohol dehydrogenase family)
MHAKINFARMQYSMNSVEGRVVIVTGGNSGIGFEIAKGMSLLGAKVIIACRDEAKGLQAQHKINGQSEYINLDLGSFARIQAFIDSIKAKFSTVDILINNAGVLWPPFAKTDDQLELTFGINYIGHYVLTNKVMPLLRDVPHSRVVNMSSIAQYSVRAIDWENINSQKHYSKSKAYNLSNMFRTMFTLELEDRLRQKDYKTIAVACHPGVTLTHLQRFLPSFPGYSLLAKLMNNTVFQQPHEAAMSALAAATSRDIRGGDFVGLHTKRQYRGNPKVVLPNTLAFDKRLRERLWSISQEITGVDLD